MSNYFGGLHPQFNNKHSKNKLIDQYKQTANNNIPFQNNQMLMNNPAYYGSIRESDFHDRINMAKREYAKNIKSVSDLRLSKDQLVKYVIDPLKVEKMEKKDLDNKYINLLSTYADKKKIPQYMKDLWEGRQNTPYKNILKDEKYRKEFKKKEDLIVHKVTQLDKDIIIMDNRLKNCGKDREKHKKELKMIYTASRKKKFSEKFEYINKFQHKIQYDPKNYNDLKLKYVAEQKKLNKEGKRIDEMIEMLIATNQLSGDELKEVTELQRSSKYDYVDDHKMEKIFAKGEIDLEKKLEKELEKEIKKQVGNDAFKEIMKEIIFDDAKNTPKILVKSKNSIVKNKSDNNEKDKLPKIKVTTNKIIVTKKKKLDNENSNKGTLADEELAKYKNRKSSD